MSTEHTVTDLLSYISRAATPFHTVEESSRLLRDCGFQELSLEDRWTLTAGKSYCVRAYGSTLFAFTVGEGFREGGEIHLACAHTDQPCLRVKPKAEMPDHGYCRLDVEVYGGAILNTWLDRPLSIAGRVTLRSGDIYHPVTKLVDFARPLLTIPNLAMHMNSDVNKGTALNKQTEMLPIIGLTDDGPGKEDFFVRLLAQECGAAPEDILDFDLFIYNAEEGCVLGAEGELISSPRLDNLTSCYACLNAIASASAMAKVSERLNVIALYDNEEIGSRTKQGADSMITNLLLEKIYDGLSYDTARLTDSYFKSMMLSLDVAHAYHPNYGQKSDPNLIVTCGLGPAIKLNYSQRYATDTEAVGIICQLCEANNIPYQKYVNRSDITGGGTIGTIASSYVPMRTVDIGIGILAMHSAREMMASADQEHLNALVYCFFL